MTVVYYRPATLGHTLDLLAEFGARATVVAGGQDVVPRMNQGSLQPDVLIDISALDDLRDITQDAGRVTIGSLVAHRELERVSPGGTGLGLLAQAAGQIGGGVQVRNRGTIGGAVCAGDPAYDYPACLVALDAQLRLASARGERIVPASEFFRGARDVDRRPDELLTGIVVPAQAPGAAFVYRKLKFTNGCYGIVAAACALALSPGGDVTVVRLAIGGATAAPVRLRSVELLLTGLRPAHGRVADETLAAAAEYAERAIEEPLTDVMADGDYRRAMAGVMARRALADALAKAVTRAETGSDEPPSTEPCAANGTARQTPQAYVRREPALAGGSVPVRFVVNGERRGTEVDPRAPLVYVLREAFGLTGTRFGCLTGHCGACTVMLNGRAVKACTMLAASADGAEVRTIEGLADGARLHPLQQAFWDHFGFQCGYCTPGMIMTAVELLAARPRPDDEEIRAGLAGNLCRCTGYQGIVRAIRAAAEAVCGGAASLTPTRENDKRV